MRRTPRVSSTARVLPVLLALAAACTSPTEDPKPPERAQLLVQDELHGDGTKGFVWLPPVVDVAPPVGAANEVLARPSVKVFRLTTGAPQLVATFSPSSGPAGEPTRLAIAGQPLDAAVADGDPDQSGFWFARWKTKDAGVEDGVYRVKVYVPALRFDGALEPAGRELGFADVELVRKDATYRHAGSDAFLPLADGETLRLKFRVTVDVVDFDRDGLVAWGDNCPDAANAGQLDTDGDGKGDACECAGVTCQPTDACHLPGTCSPKTGACTTPIAPDETACDDHDGCTQTDRCEAGECVGSDPLTCTASDACHEAGVCEPSTGRCTNPAKDDGTACDDTDLCTEVDTCQAGECVGASPITCAPSDECHVIGSCDPQTGECSNPEAPEGTDCSDGDACTLADSCVAGACVGANPVACAPSDTCHAAGACDPATGRCSNPTLADGARCDDGNACTQADSCTEGTCAGAEPITCAALDACHVAGSCDPTTGVCSNPPQPDGLACQDGDACTDHDTCQEGRCTGGAPITCAASDACHVAGTCDPQTGACSTPAAPEGTACDDGNPCTEADACVEGACAKSKPVTCVASDACHEAGQCNPSTGRCEGPAKEDGAACDDGNGCTQGDSCTTGNCVGATPVVCAPLEQCHVAGSCNPVTGECTSVPKEDGATCDDGNACTQGDSCQAGACRGAGQVTCVALDECHDTGICDPQTGACTNPAKQDGTACDDGDACTQGDSCLAGACADAEPVTCAAIDSCHLAGECDPLTGACSAPAKEDGASCDDGDTCTLVDSCQGGSCEGTEPVVCTASDECHDVGACNPETGQCANPAKVDGASCDDENACTQADSCQAGACTGASPVTCVAVDSCHESGTCNPTTGTCSQPVKVDGASCSDGNACTTVDTCLSGRCLGATPVVCTAIDQCHLAGQCDPASGECSTPAMPDGTTCNDGSACTQADSCQAGTCTGANPIVCVASDQCHDQGTCEPTTGLCSNPAKSDGASCTDGNACTRVDACRSGVCAGASPVTCTAQDQCHAAGTCDPTSGTCSNPAKNDGTVCSDGNGCTQHDTCEGGSCVGADPVTCTATDDCHGAGTCDPSSGQCSSPALSDGTACSDGNGCTRADSCQSGTCTGSNPVTCVAVDQCHGAGTCNPSSGQCSSPALSDGTSCNDGNLCTRTDACVAGTCTGANPVTCAATDLCHVAGTCDPSTGACTNPAATDGKACDDGDACTLVDRCEAGACEPGSPTGCADGGSGEVCLTSAEQVCPGGVGCACSAGSDCRSGTCGWAADGRRVCADACEPCCGGGQDCGWFGEDRACVPPDLALCQPCLDDASCQQAGDKGARCVKATGGEAYCGSSCDAGACPSGYECRDATLVDGSHATQCVPAAGGSCSCNAFGVATSATTRCLFGASCAGTRRCGPGSQGTPTLLACARNASAPETCDGLDNDCDGQIDEGCDDDHDGTCAAGALVVAGATCTGVDCDDHDAAIKPGATELAGDGVDQDCDHRELCFIDFDLDGARTSGTWLSVGATCDTSAGLAYGSAPIDCNDQVSTIRPGRTELVGDGVDTDCDGRELCYVDFDVDGARAERTWLATGIECRRVDGLALATAPLDCNDNETLIHPGAQEIVGNGVDRDCDGHVLCFVDADGDGYRTDSTVASADLVCGPTRGTAYVDVPSDCEDGDYGVHAGAVEASDDGVDSDCNGVELFDGVPLAVTGRMSRGAFSVALAGAFPMARFGTVSATGTATRGADGIVRWCVEGTSVVQFPNWGFEGTARVCRTADASPALITLDGFASADGLRLHVTGESVRASGELALVPDGTVSVHGAAWDVDTNPAHSAFRMGIYGAGWAVEATRPSLQVDPRIVLDVPRIFLGPGKADVSATAILGAGQPQGLLHAGGPLGRSGAFHLNLTPTALHASIPVFKSAQSPLGLRALDATGSLDGDGVGNATATVHANAFCAGNCCTPHTGGRCEVTAMSDCAVGRRPSCASSWTNECVGELAACEVWFGKGVSMVNPALTLTVGGGKSWTPDMDGAAHFTDFDLLAPPPMALRTAVDSCRDPVVRACAGAIDSACDLDGWNSTCDTLVTTRCGGLSALGKCGDGSVFLHAESTALWEPLPIGLGPDRFFLRNLEWNRWYQPNPFTSAGPLNSDAWLLVGGAKADSVLCLSGACSQEWLTTAPRGTVDLLNGGFVTGVRGVLAESDQYFIGELANLKLPVFEQPLASTVVFSVNRLGTVMQPFDVLDTPDDPRDDIPIAAGLTLATFGPAGIPIPDAQFTSHYPVPVWVVASSVTAEGAKLEATGLFDWTLLPPNVVPSIDRVTLDHVSGYMMVTTSAMLGSIGSVLSAPIKNAFKKQTGGGTAHGPDLTFGVEAGVKLQPSNQTTPLFGSVSLELLPATNGGSVAGNIWLAGKWIEPFALEDFAVQGLGMTAYFNIETGAPTAFGMNRSLFWKGPGCEWPSEAQDWLYDSGCLTSFKFAFLFMPKLTYMFYGQLSNIDLNTGTGMLNSLAKSGVNLVNFALAHTNDVTALWSKLFKDLVWDETRFGEFKNVQEIPKIDMPLTIPQIAGFNLKLKDLRAGFAPLPVTRWGQDFKAGAVANFEVSINDTWNGQLFGEVQNLAFLPVGLHLHGAIDPIKLGTLQLVGDPFARAVTLNGGWVDVPASELLNPSPLIDAMGNWSRATVEALVKKASWAPGESATLYERGDSRRGLTVRLARLGRSPVPAPETQNEELDFSNGQTAVDLEGRDPGEDKAWILVECRQDGEFRTYTTERGVVPASTAWQHVAVSLRGGDAIAVVDEQVYTLKASGAFVAFGWAPYGAQVGRGFDAIDEFRYWKTNRTAVQLKENARYLGVASRQDEHLVAAYSFDWDTGTLVHNSRNRRALDGSLQGGAVVVPAVEERIAYAWNVDWATWPPTSESALLAGASIPSLIGDPLTFRLWARQSSTTLSTNGEFYAAPIVPIHLPWGDFRLTGRGPNGVYDDFDDGLYGGYENTTTSFGMEGSGRLDFVQSGGHSTLGAADLSITCPGSPCGGPDTFKVKATASIDIPMQLPPLPMVRIAGLAIIDDKKHTMDVDGFIEVNGMRISSSGIHVDGQHLSLESGLDLGPIFGEILGPANVALDMTYQPFQLCGQGALRNAADTEDVCDVNVCLSVAGVPTWELRSLQCFGLCWHDGMCGENEFCDHIGRCFAKKPDGYPCLGLVDGNQCQSGFCDPWKFASVDPYTLGACSVPLDDWIGCTDGAQCKSGYCGNRPGKLVEKHCFTPGTAKLGEECGDTLHCGEGQCWGTLDWGSRCLCETDTQCASSSAVAPGTVCKAGIWGQTTDSGFCVAPRPAGGACYDASDCQAGLSCENGTCFQPHSKSNFQACVSDSECVTGLCWNWQCRCRNHDECWSDPAYGPAAYCDMGTWGAGNEEGHCRATRVGDDQYCEDDVWCQSGHCANNRCYTPRTKHNFDGCVSDDECVSGSCWNWQCRCASHDQCAADPAYGANSYCDQGTWQANNQEGRCHAKTPNGQYCEDNTWCQSGNCNGQICITAGSKHNWEACDRDAECVGGSLCWNYKCRCWDNAQCTSDGAFGANSFCNTGDWFPANDEGHCYAPKRANGEGCENDSWCASGACGGGVCFQPYSVPNWGYCSDSRQCANGACWNGQCHCTAHDQCQAEYGPNGYCDLGTWNVFTNDGRCRTDKAPSDVSAYCEDGAWCQSGLCTWSQKIGQNICFTYRGNRGGEWCDVHQQCASGYCRQWWNGWFCD